MSEVAAGSPGRRRLVLVAVVALLFRSVAIWSSPAELTGDAEEYAALGKHLRFDGVFSMGGPRSWGHHPNDPADGRLAPSAWRPPGFPLVFAALWGNDPNRPPTRRVQVFNAVCGTTTAVLTVSIAGSVFPGLVVAAWPLMIQADVDPYSEALFDVLLMGGLWLWMRGFLKSAGIVLGLGSLTRITLFPCLLLFLFVSCWRAPRRRGCLTVAVFGLLTISPWIIRNEIVFREFIPVAIAGSGTNLMAGTIFVPLFSGAALYARFNADPEFSKITHGNRDDVETERLMRGAGIRRIVAHPFRWVAIRIAQYPRLLLDNGEHWYRPGLVWPIKIVTLGLSTALVMAGLIGLYSVRYDLQRWLPALLLLAGTLALHAPILVVARLGAPLIPLWAVFASFCLPVRRKAECGRPVLPQADGAAFADVVQRLDRVQYPLP